ncbi:MAG: hypothetical protein K0U12_01815 [Gammaproteobacteria bacterium]|nr:hypothetical protein [Gammaproteobacteria bacterium]
MLSESSIVDYQCVPIDMVNHYLQHGYTLWGMPVILMNQVLQAMIKRFDKVILPEKSANLFPDPKLILTQNEQQCLSLLRDDYCVKQLEVELDCSSRHVTRLLKSLRQKLHCQNNTALVFTAYKKGCLH